MKWSTTVLLMLVLLIFTACAAPVPLAPGAAEEKVQQSDATQPVVTVYKSPTCGCCEDWVEHMEENGFTVETTDINDLTAIKAENGVPIAMQSCHTAIVDGYVIEGHVPAADISRLLAERPNVTGLAVPGMPIGSPGMEMPGRAGQPFDVLTFDEAGASEVFASHNQE